MFVKFIRWFLKVPNNKHWFQSYSECSFESAQLRQTLNGHLSLKLKPAEPVAAAGSGVLITTSAATWSGHISELV